MQNILSSESARSGNRDEMMKYLNDNKERIAAQVSYNKTFQFLIDNAKIKEKIVDKK